MTEAAAAAVSGAKALREQCASDSNLRTVGYAQRARRECRAHRAMVVALNLLAVGAWPSDVLLPLSCTRRCNARRSRAECAGREPRTVPVASCADLDWHGAWSRACVPWENALLLLRPAQVQARRFPYGTFPPGSAGPPPPASSSCKHDDSRTAHSRLGAPVRHREPHPPVHSAVRHHDSRTAHSPVSPSFTTSRAESIRP